MADTKLSKKEWEEKRADTKLGLKSLVQGIGQLEYLGVLTPMEKSTLTTAGIHIETIITDYEARSKVSKEIYCNGK